MGGLIAAGIISGAGAGLSKGLDESAKIYIEGERQKYDNLRLEKTLAATASEGQKTRDLTTSEGILNRAHADKAQDKGIASTEKMDAERRWDARTMHDATLENAKVLAAASISSHEKLSGDQITSHEKMNSATIASHEKIAQLSLQATKDNVTLMPQEDGTLMRVQTHTGKILGKALDPATGQVYQGTKPVTEMTKLLIGLNKTQIEAYAHDLTRNGSTMSVEDKKAINDRMEYLKQDSQTLLGRPPVQKSGPLQITDPLKPSAPKAPVKVESLVDAGTKKPSAPVHPGRYATKEQQAKYDSDMAAWQAGKPVAPTFPGKYASAQERGRYEIALAEYEAAQSER